jgi:hypothetical protein
VDLSRAAHVTEPAQLPRELQPVLAALSDAPF